MTTYQTGATFRRALEDRLLAQSHQTTVSLVRLRKLVAFDRFLARLIQAQPGAWILKGGLALKAIRATFSAQGAGAPPLGIPAPPAAWAATFGKLAEEVGLSCTTLPVASQVARRFLEPVLRGSAQGIWSPGEQIWT